MRALDEDGETTPIVFAMKSSAMKSPPTTLSPSAAKLRLLKKLRCTLRYEKKAWAAGARLVAGVDEVGRGSLFGCVVAAAVILDPAYRVRGLRDSKLLPRGAPRGAGRAHPRARGCVGGRGRGRGPHRSDQYLSRVASRHARSRDATRACSRPPAGRCLASRLRAAASPHHSWRRAVGLDRGGVDPGEGGARSHDVRVGRGVSWYGLASHKGYSTPQHLAALREFGPTPLHRQSFAPVWQNPVPQEAFAIYAGRTTCRWTKVQPDERVSGGRRKISTVFLQEHFY